MRSWLSEFVGMAVIPSSFVYIVACDKGVLSRHQF